MPAVEARLARAAGKQLSGLTEPDPGGTERWTADQVWAHIAEFIPYWIAECRLVTATYAGEPVAFGRTKQDPGRLASIASGLETPPASFLSSIPRELADLRTFLRELGPEDWAATGLHPTKGSMPLNLMIEEFLVGHLEEHADQLSLLEDRS